MNMMRYEQIESVWDAIEAKPRYETVAAVMRALKVKMVVGVRRVECTVTVFLKVERYDRLCYD
jgi:hypothetical protein